MGLEQILTPLLTKLLLGLTGTQSIIVAVILLICYLFFIVFKKKLPFIITTRKTLDLIIKAIRTTDKDIIDLNAVYVVQLDGIIVSNIKVITAHLWSHIYRCITENHAMPIPKEKEHALIILSLLLTYELRDAIKQLTRENGFLDMSKDDLYNYSKSKEFVLYDIIEQNFNLRYFFNSEDALYSLINNDTPTAIIVKNRISESYFNLFKNIQVHLIKRQDKTNALMSHNEEMIKEFI